MIVLVAQIGKHILGKAMSAAGSVAIEEVQRALKGYAQVSGKFTIDPGIIDGVMNAQTAGALFAAASDLDFGDLGAALLGVAGEAISSGNLPSLNEFVSQYSAQIVLTLQNAAAGNVDKPPAAGPSRAGRVRTAATAAPAAMEYIREAVKKPWYRTWKVLIPIGVVAAAGTAVAIRRRSS